VVVISFDGRGVHYVFLQRNLIYTAVTRGRKLVVMVGTKKALAIGVKNDKTQKRYTRLNDRLDSENSHPGKAKEA